MTTLQTEHVRQNPIKVNKRTLISYDMSKVATVILGGGQGSRLFPLTRADCKPAITFGGKYRLIDVPMSNAINSGCQKIFVVTQFLSKSLHEHIFKTYRPGSFSSGFVEVLSVEEKPQAKCWFQGTADAIRQNLDYLMDVSADYFLILSGDQLYQMNYQKMMHVALETDADVVICTLPVREDQASRLGILKINQDARIIDFCEKPTEKEQLERLRMDSSILESLQIKTSNETPYLGSMGIYLFKRKVLLQLLMHDMREDFGKHLIPTIINNGNVAAYLHDGYWEDIGTIESYYNANMALTRSSPDFNCYDEEYPLISHHLNLSPPKIYNTHIHQSIICEGSLIEAREVSNSILGARTIVKKNSVIRNSCLLGNDFYQSPIPNGRIPDCLQIGENCHIERTIIDKHVCIGNNVQLINKDKLTHFNNDNVYVRDGIIIVPRGSHLPDGFIF